MSFRIRMAALAVAALFVTGSGLAALAHSVTAGTLSITDLWTRATPPNAPTAAGYLTITNDGDEPDRLVAVSSPLAEKAGIHEMSLTDGVMTMRAVSAGVEIPAGGEISLAPGGYHIMFSGLKEAFTEGGEVPVTLTFEKAGTVETFLHVEALGAPGPGKGEHQHGAGGGAP